MSSPRTALDGARIYSNLLLRFYDFLIMRVLSPFVWRCQPESFHALYRAFMSSNHADIGVGTGYCLNQCHYRSGQLRLGLFDMQKNCLDFTAQRLSRFRPQTFLCNAAEPIQFKGKAFDSIALGGVLHCIPGEMREKGKVFDSIDSLMHPSTKVFGYTILNEGVKKTVLSRVVYRILYVLKVINGNHDSATALSAELRKRFEYVDTNVVGCVALFFASKPLNARGTH